MARIADTLRDVAEQSRALRSAAEALPAAHRDLVAEIAGDAYARIVDTSPVQTGAYRAEHVIELGDGERGGTFVFEPDSRPGADAVVQVDAGSTLDAPDVSAARSALKAIEPFASVSIVNRRSYADAIENGTSNREPRRIYARAAQSAEAEAESAEIPEQRLTRGVR